MSKHLTEIKAMIYEFGLLFNNPPSAEKISAYANVLSELSSDQLRFALNKIIRSGTAFFPSVGEIFAQLKPASFDEAPLVANEILKLIRTYGPHNEAELMAVASPVARAVLNQVGSTHYIRNSEQIETIRAQLERIARAMKSKMESDEHFQQLQRIGTSEKFKPGLRKVDFKELF